MDRASPDWPYKTGSPAEPDGAVAGRPEEVGAAIARDRPRGLRRTLGQFWTPDPIAERMVRWALRGSPGRFLDPGAGPLTFVRAAERLFGAGRASCVAFELDPALAAAARASQGCEVRAEDFLRTAARLPGVPVVCNPPYTRHHDIRDEVKAELRAWAERTFGFRPSGFLGTYGWFLLKALDVTDARARLCFITPVELYSARSGVELFRDLPARFWPRRVVVCGPDIDAFAGVDATAAISFFDPQAADVEPALLVLRAWPTPDALDEWLDAPRSSRSPGSWGDVRPLERGRRPAIATPPAEPAPHRIALRTCAAVTRGVATGANAFFLFDARRRAASRIAAASFVRVIARARDATRLTLDLDDLDALEARGRPTYLLALGRDAQTDGALRRHLAEGERQGLSARPLLSRRRPWWLTEARDAPAILFTYLSRDNPRFVLNEAGAAALTTFLAVRPAPPPAGVSEADWRTCLAAALNTPGTLASLEQHARSYGGRTRKIEPRELEQIELPAIGTLPAPVLAERAAAAREWLATADRAARERAAAEWERETLELLEASRTER